MSLYRSTKWMSYLLTFAGIYNILWGLIIVALPYLHVRVNWFELSMSPLTWQIIGLVAIVFGIGYAIASKAPFKYWLVVLTGLTGKLFGTVTFLYLYFQNLAPLELGITVITNSIIWLIPFGIILYGAFEHRRFYDEQLNYLYSSRADTDALSVKTNKGVTVAQLSEENPVMVVFLRHFGCTFCREALSTLASDKPLIEALGTKIVLVHMVDEETAARETQKYGLEDLNRISDPSCRLYDEFALEKGNLRQLLGLKVLLRGLKAGLIDRNYIGQVKGEPSQLSGVFLIYKNTIEKAYRHYTAADTPDYIYMATLETFNREKKLYG